MVHYHFVRLMGSKGQWNRDEHCPVCSCIVCFQFYLYNCLHCVWVKNYKYSLQVGLQKHCQCLRKLEKTSTRMLLCSAPLLTTGSWMKWFNKANTSLSLEEDFWVQNLPVHLGTNVRIFTWWTFRLLLNFSSSGKIFSAYLILNGLQYM